MNRTCLLGLLTVFLNTGVTVANAAYDDPQILTIEETIGTPLASYTAKELSDQFEQKTIETSTPWTNGQKVSYRGFRLNDLLDKHGIADRKFLHGIGLNGYQSKIEMDDILKYDPIVATKIGCNEADRETNRCAEGEHFRALDEEDFGPFYIVWPQHELPQTAEPGDNSRWTWFLVGLRPSS